MLLRSLRAVAIILTIVIAACATTSTPSPTPPPSASVCPSVATVKALVAAWNRADGAAAAALFTADGSIQGPAFRPGISGGTGAGRWEGAVEISQLITGSTRGTRSVELIDGPEGCGAVVTWGQRLLPLNPGSPVDVRATGMLRDGKIASVVYVEAPR